MVWQPDPGNPQFSLPMDVTVSITGMTHQIYFLSPLMGFYQRAFAASPALPVFATTLQSEDTFSD